LAPRSRCDGRPNERVGHPHGYSDKPGKEDSDGARCAGQLCAILLQIDSTPKGRQWFAGLDPFQPDKKNLVWRMLSLNNAGISQELHAALAQLTHALPPVRADRVAGVTSSGCIGIGRNPHWFDAPLVRLGMDQACERAQGDGHRRTHPR
jgi:hypothetical protein